MKYYVVTITGKQEIVDFLDKYVPRTNDTLSRARETRRAVEVLFGDEAKVDIKGREDRVL